MTAVLRNLMIFIYRRVQHEPESNVSDSLYCVQFLNGLGHEICRQTQSPALQLVTQMALLELLVLFPGLH